MQQLNFLGLVPSHIFLCRTSTYLHLFNSIYFSYNNFFSFQKKILQLLSRWRAELRVIVFGTDGSEYATPSAC
ncbi:unnamed protein product [Prunus brigantina]